MNSRLLGLLLLIASLVGLGVSLPAMAQRLSHREDLKNRPMVWFEEPVYDEVFTFRAEPVSVKTITADGTGQPLAVPEVVVTWRGSEARFPVPPGFDDPRLPGLLRHSDWFKIMPMVAARGSSDQDVRKQIAEGAITPTLIAAARYPAEGYDAGSWGLVRRREWKYRYAEFRAEGPPESAIETSEATYAELERFIAPGPYDKPLGEVTDAERERKLWQHAAMLQVTPAMLYRAKDKQVQSGIHAMGWTWPVAGVSVLGVILGAGLVALSGLSRR